MSGRHGLGAVALLIGALAVVGCETRTSSSPAQATSAVAPSDVPPPSDGNPMPSFDLASFDLGSFALPSADPDLEALLPDDIGGQTVRKFSMTGASFINSRGSETDELDAVLEGAGKTPADLSVAFAGTDDVSLIAYRIRGVPAETFFQAFLAAAQRGGEVTVTEATLGGKSVRKLVAPTTAIGTVYVYGSDDVLFIVGGEGVSDANLTEAFSELG